MLSNPKKTMKTFTWLSAVGAFFLWSSYAYWTNSTSSGAMVSALAQGFYSFVMTFCLAYFVKLLYEYPFFQNHRNLVPITIVGVSGVLLTVMHLSIQTSNVASTVVPPNVVAYLFCALSVRKLEILSSKHSQDNLHKEGG